MAEISDKKFEISMKKPKDIGEALIEEAGGTPAIIKRVCDLITEEGLLPREKAHVFETNADYLVVGKIPNRDPLGWPIYASVTPTERGYVISFKEDIDIGDEIVRRIYEKLTQ